MTVPVMPGGFHAALPKAHVTLASVMLVSCHGKGNGKALKGEKRGLEPLSKLAPTVPLVGGVELYRLNESALPG
jgi:hypothetical protein